MKFIQSEKSLKLFIILAGFFITNALIAEFIGVKIFSLEQTLGYQPFNFNFFGIEHLSFNLTAGVLLWPVVFTLTDILNEYYGVKGVRFLSYLTVGLICFAFLIVFSAIRLTPADFWPTSHLQNESLNGSPGPDVRNLNSAFSLVFGQGLWIIIGSMVAFLIGQLIDVLVFHKIKKFTGNAKIWMRSLVSTVVSQLIDSFVVLFIAFYIGAGWSMSQVMAIGTVNFIYKLIMAALLLPLIYILHYAIEYYLGKPHAEDMKREAMIQN